MPSKNGSAEASKKSTTKKSNNAQSSLSEEVQIVNRGVFEFTHYHIMFMQTQVVQDSKSVKKKKNQQIRNLQKQLQDQFAVRHVLENALNHQPLSSEAELDESIPKVFLSFMFRIIYVFFLCLVLCPSN